VGTLDVAADMGVGDHACWGYDDPVDYLGQVVLYLAEGGERGDRLWYVGDKSRASLLADLRLLAKRDELCADGQLIVSTTKDVYGPVGRFDIAAVLDRFRAEASRAVADGFRCLRLATDVTAVATDGATGMRLICHEIACDKVVARSPLIVMCGYAQSRIGADFPALAAVHPLRHGTIPEALFSLHWTSADLRLTGEVDYFTGEQLRVALQAVTALSAGPLLIDLSDLHFIDVGATRVLAQAVQTAELSDRRVRLRNPRPTVLRCLEVFDLTSRVEWPPNTRG
jgi:anti-anti-sigma factor